MDAVHRSIVRARTSILIASDVDGTLLDDHGRLPCTPVVLRKSLNALAAYGTTCTLALASSRTLRELVALQRAIGISGPCIAEDGAVLATDHHDACTQAMTYGRRTVHVWQQARSAAALRGIMHDSPIVEHADAAQLTRQQLFQLGFRTSGAIRRALHARHHSILLDPLRIPLHEIELLRTVATARQLQLRRGGKWLTLSDTSGKGSALMRLRRMVSLYGTRPLLVGIGNEENDTSLLEVADLAFVIRNPRHGPHPALAAIPHAIVLDEEGPRGWLEMLTRVQELIT